MRFSPGRMTAAAVAALVAALLMAATPVLLGHHHHARPQDDTRCAVCAFVSAHLSRPPAPPTVAPPVTSVGVVRPVTWEIPASPRLTPHDKRAPPLV